LDKMPESGKSKQFPGKGKAKIFFKFQCRLNLGKKNGLKSVSAGS